MSIFKKRNTEEFEWEKDLFQYYTKMFDISFNMKNLEEVTLFANDLNFYLKESDVSEKFTRIAKEFIYFIQRINKVFKHYTYLSDFENRSVIEIKKEMFLEDYNVLEKIGVMSDNFANWFSNMGARIQKEEKNQEKNIKYILELLLKGNVSEILRIQGFEKQADNIQVLKEICSEVLQQKKVKTELTLMAILLAYMVILGSCGTQKTDDVDTENEISVDILEHQELEVLKEQLSFMKEEFKLSTENKEKEGMIRVKSI